MATPYITKVYLLDVPLENDYKNTLYFSSKANQQSYFQSNIVKSYTDFSYQRKEKLIRIPEIYDNLFNCNYVMYQNSNYSNKWFYAFITKMEYVNDGLTNVYIETDVMQTWAFDYDIKSSFVEREHTNNDTVGANTQPENLEKGEYICGMREAADIGTAHVVIAATYNVFDDKDAGSFINGIYQGVDYFLIGNVMSEAGISYFLGLYADAGKSDAITGMFMVPDSLTNFNNISWDYMDNHGAYAYYPYKRLTSEVLGLMTAKTLLTKTLSKPSGAINGYTPRNNKLYTFPYCYLALSNNNGAYAIYQYEYFMDSNCVFPIKGCISPGNSIKAYPQRYKGVADNYDEGLTGGKYPICSYSTDMYTNWLTQNSVNIALGVGSSVLTMAGGIGMMATGAGALAGAGAIVSGAMGIASTLGEVYQHSLVPPQAEGNLNCGDVNYGMGATDFSFFHMNIRSEYAQIIDKYFDMFGYKTNLVKIPNKAHRSRWWYTKTLDINIDGAIPDEDMQKIKNCYNNGITFWRNASEICNYSLSNGIV